MAHELASILSRTITVTALAVAASTGLFVGLRGARGLSYDATNLIDCLVISILVGAPILFYLISRSERLKEEHARVATLHVALERTHADLEAAHATASSIVAFAGADRCLYETKRVGRNRVQFDWALEEVG